MWRRAGLVNLSSAIYLVKCESFEYLILSIVVEFLVKLFSYFYSFTGSSFVLVVDALVEGL